MHSNGASLFFLFVYLHIARSLYAGSYTYPRVKLFNIGVVIYILMMGIAFLGKLNCLKRYLSYQNSSNLPFNYIKKYDNLHTIQTQSLIAKENRHKSGIYLIYNNINGKFYIGSAVTNRINTRFRNHCIHGVGSALLSRAINKYGLENFTFFIIEYYPGFIHKEDLKSAHLELLSIETKFINLLNPAYNILTTGGSSLGYKHNKETIDKIKTNYSEERKVRIGKLNRARALDQDTKDIMSQKMKIRYLETNYKDFLSKKFSKAIILYNLDGTVHSEYSSISEMKKVFNCCNKTINKAIKSNSIFKGIGHIKYKEGKTDK
jgi:group I intron endonuclease